MDEIISILKSEACGNREESTAHLPDVSDLYSAHFNNFRGVAVRKQKVSVHGTESYIRRVFLQCGIYKYVGWMVDEDAYQCMVCAVDFDTFTRKHHCRVCGDIVCADCSAGTLRITELLDWGPVRACAYCNYGQEEVSIIPPLTRIVSNKYSEQSSTDYSKLRQEQVADAIKASRGSDHRGGIGQEYDEYLHLQQEEAFRLAQKDNSKGSADILEHQYAKKNLQTTELQLEKDHPLDREPSPRVAASEAVVPVVLGEKVAGDIGADVKSSIIPNPPIEKQIEKDSNKTLLDSSKVVQPVNSPSSLTSKVTGTENCSTDTVIEFSGEPYAVVKTRQHQQYGGGKVFINICLSEEVTEAVIGQNCPHTIISRSGDECSAYDVCIHPGKLENSENEEVYYDVIEKLNQECDAHLESAFTLPRIRKNFKGDHQPMFTASTHSVPSPPDNSVRQSISMVNEDIVAGDKHEGVSKPERLSPVGFTKITPTESKDSSSPRVCMGWLSREEGTIMKVFKRRYFVLDKGTLTCFERSSETPPYGLNKKYSVTLRRSTELDLVNAKSKPLTLNQLYISDPVEKTDILLEAESVEDHGRWVQALLLHKDYNCLLQRRNSV